MRKGSVNCVGPTGVHRIAYTDWGDAMNPRVLICVHGLTRNGRDFDALANALCGDYRVICPDVVGRGDSDWLDDKKHYDYPLYGADMATLIADIGAREVHWVGTSMGGLIGMSVAAQPNSPITRMVLNDVGPHIPKAAVARIVDYLGDDPRFATLEALDEYLQEIHGPFGPYSQAEWAHLVAFTARKTQDGDWGLNYDPGIAVPMVALPPVDVNVWEVWDAIQCPVQLLWGTVSDVLVEHTVKQMRTRGPSLEVVTLDGIGHAPSLTTDDQIGMIKEWLLRDE